MKEGEQQRAIFGAGGFAQEVSLMTGVKNFFVDDKYARKGVIPISEFDEKRFSLLICLGESRDREQIVQRLPRDTRFWTFIHPSAQILGDVEIGDGVVICPGCILSCAITIGNHCILNCGAKVGHDVSLGDFCSLMPSAVISGNVLLGKSVFVGANATIREKTRICANVKIGMSAAVFSNIQEAGTYAGNPARRIL